MNQTLSLSQKLQQVLSPRMLQMLKTLNLSYVDLIDDIYQQSEENPTLELDRQDELFSYARSLSDRAGASTVDGEMIEREIKANAPTLVEFLIEQLHLEDLDELDYKIGEELIHNIDERGYLQDYAQVKAELMQNLGVKRTHVDKLLGIIQSFEPDGVGARNLKECLQIQVREYNFESDTLRDIILEIIKKHFELLIKKKYDQIAELAGIQTEGVERVAEFIEKNLTHNPGFMYRNEENVRTVVPSFVVEKKEDGSYAGINLEEKKGPTLRISQSYLSAINDPSVDEETKIFIREKLEKAKQFIEDIKKRHEITQKIIDIITSRQQEFFESGYYWLKPLQQNELSRLLGIHRSTISRAVSTKYVQTPRGLLPLKYLCPRDFKGFSAAQIKGMMLKILDEKPKMSDQKLAEYLKQERGINIKRRTVTKYRLELGFGSSRERKQDGN